MSRTRYSTICALLAAGLLGSTHGCGGDAPEPAKGAARGASATDPETKKARQALEKDLATLQNALVNRPLEPDRTIADADKYAAQAAALGARDLVAKCEEIKKQAREVFESAAEKEVADAQAKVREYLAKGDFKMARNRTNVAKAMEKESRYSDRISALRKEIESTERAERYYEKVTRAKADQFKSQNEWERAQGVLEAFLTLPAFKASPRSKDVEKSLAEAKAKADEIKAARASDNAILPIPAFRGRADDLHEWNLSDPNACNVSEDTLTFKHDADDAPHATMSFGEDEWEDYVLDFSIRMEKGPFYVSVRGTRPNEDADRVYEKPLKIDTSDCSDKTKFYRVRVEVRGNKLTWRRPGSSAPSTSTLTNAKGPFLFGIPKGAEVQLKGVFVKVYKPQKSGGSNK